MVFENIIASQNTFCYNNSAVKAEEQNKEIQYTYHYIKNAILQVTAKGLSPVKQ